MGFDPTIVVIDYHKGNLSSVERGLAAVGARVLVSDDPEKIKGAAGLVLPGVGSFGDAMSFMRKSGQADAVREAIDAGVPFLGICLGLQLLFERGSERTVNASSAIARTLVEQPLTAWVEGLGVFPGECTRLVSTRLKVPHVGWNQVDFTERGSSCALLEGVANGANFYYTHSYAVETADDDIVMARTHYVRSFPAVVACGNVYGCQFHPEKSSATGLTILRNFAEIVETECIVRASLDEVRA